MMLAAPEFVVTEFVELLDQADIALKLQHRMFADRVMRGEEGAETKAGHAWKLLMVGRLIPIVLPDATCRLFGGRR